MDQALTLAIRAGDNANVPASAPKTVSLIIENMTCGSCIGRVERALRDAPGVSAARANLAAKRVAVTFDEAATEPLRLIEALDRSGYRAAESHRAMPTTAPPSAPTISCAASGWPALPPPTSCCFRCRCGSAL